MKNSYKAIYIVGDKNFNWLRDEVKVKNYLFLE